MIKYFVMGLLNITTSFLFAQNIDAIVNAKEVERIERVLSSDEMQGRRTFTPSIDKAADYIASEFKSAHLQTWNNTNSYRQEFVMVRPKFISASAVLDGNVLEEKNIIVITSQPDLHIDQSSGYEIATIKS